MGSGEAEAGLVLQLLVHQQNSGELNILRGMQQDREDGKKKRKDGGGVDNNRQKILYSIYKSSHHIRVQTVTEKTSS